MTPQLSTTSTPQQAQPSATSTPQQPSTGHSKEAALVAKMYTDDQRYDGVSKSFDFKLTIFEDICRRAGLPLDKYMIVFPNILKGIAQDHYYSQNLSTRTYNEACNHIQNFFKGPEFFRKNLTE